MNNAPMDNAPMKVYNVVVSRGIRSAPTVRVLPLAVKEQNFKFEGEPKINMCRDIALHERILLYFGGRRSFHEKMKHVAVQLLDDCSNKVRSAHNLLRGVKQ